MATRSYDIAIIGGGIIGTATGMLLSAAHPRYRVGLLDKEGSLARHQSGRNSGVIHSGIYYAPGSLKATNCVAGARSLLRFCEENEVEYDLCGKVIVATERSELPRLDELYRRGKANGVAKLEMIEPGRLAEIEPHATGIRALSSKGTGIVDFKKVTRAYARNLERNGGEILLGARVEAIRPSGDRLRLCTPKGDVETRYLINCAGLHADVVARMAGLSPGLRIVPFRGEYYRLRPEAEHLVRGLVYPVPDPEFPFLGVHLTRTIGGGVEAGPNAVPALAREGYSKASFRPGEILGTLGYRGFWGVARRYWKTGLREAWRSFSRKAFARALQRLVPEIGAGDLVAAPAGVRAQAVEPTGRLVDDFRIVEARNSIHLLNAPSPGATASLSIGRAILALAAKNFGLRA